MMEFSVGDKVSFEPSDREKQIGILVKYNKKTVTVLTENGQKWNVSPYLLKKMQETKGKVKKTGNVIEIKS